MTLLYMNGYFIALAWYLGGVSSCEHSGVNVSLSLFALAITILLGLSIPWLLTYKWLQSGKKS